MAGEDVKIVFRTAAELKGAEQLAENLEKQIGKAKALGQNYTKLNEQLNTVNANLASARQRRDEAAKAASEALAAAQKAEANSLRGLISQLPGGKSLLKVVEALASPIGVAAGALGGLAAAASKSIKEFAALEQATIGLDAALAQNGLLTDQYREQLQGLSQELQNATAIGDEKWLDVLIRLTQFGSDPKTIGMDIEAVKNLAGLMGGNLQSAVNAYARALEGQFQAFGRMGIKIDETLPQLEKMEQLQRELAEKGGGQLEARAKSLTGQFHNMREAAGDVFEGFGRLIANTGFLQGGLDTLTTAFQFVAEAIGGPVEKLDGLKNKIVETKDATFNAAEATRAHADAMGSFKEQATFANDALTKQLTLLEESGRGELELLRKRKEIALAKVELEEKDPELKARRKGAIGAAFQAAEIEIAAGTDRAKETAIGQAAAAAKARAVEADQEANKAEREAKAIKEFVEADKKRQKLAQLLDESERGLKAERDRVARSFGMAKPESLPLDSPMVTGPQANIYRLDIARARAGLPGATARAEALRAGLPAAFPDVATADKFARESRDTANATLAESAGQINIFEERRDALRRSGRQREAMAGLDTERRDIETQGGVGAARDKAAKEAAEQARRGREKLHGSLEQLIKDGGNTDARTVFLIEEIARQKREQEARLAKLESIVQNNTVP